MKVLFVNSSYGAGGAALAMGTLQKGLQDLGHSVEVAIGQLPTERSDQVHTISQRKSLPEKSLNRIAFELGLGDIGLFTTQRLAHEPWFQNADVINYHNLHGGYFNYLALPKLGRLKPGVFTLHDMWAFTGHCTYSFGCERWQSGCGRCPSPETYPAIKRDSTKLSLRMKKWAIESSRIHFVAICRWMEGVASQSKLSRCPVHYIPNGICLSSYYPEDKKECRDRLDLPQDRLILLYVAHDISDPRKGYDLLTKALREIDPAHRNNLLLIVLGKAGDADLGGVCVPYQSFGYVSDKNIKRTVFNAADICVFPTRSDNLPVVLQEALACGTPMVSFAVGGVPDIVVDGETGLLSPPEDVEGFARNIAMLIDSPDLLDTMKFECRTLAESEFSIELQARRYTHLFEQIRNEHEEGQHSRIP